MDRYDVPIITRNGSDQQGLAATNVNNNSDASSYLRTRVYEHSRGWGPHANDPWNSSPSWKCERAETLT